jgi:type IV pilus assembly protein PilV
MRRRTAEEIDVNRNHTKGFTLVEALVALLVLSIGLLGVAALQLTALQNNNNALFRSQATYLAYDITDRIRANRSTALTGGGYVVAYGAAPSGTTVERNDIRAWKTMLGATLPAGDGSIAIDAATGEAVIRIRWDDSKGVEPALVFVTRTRI